MRRRRPERRTINPDPKFNDLQISKFMNYLLEDGKKGIAEKILYDAFDIVKEKSKNDPIDIFKKALNNASPHVEVKSKRVGGATYQVPIEVPSEDSFILLRNGLLKVLKKDLVVLCLIDLAGEILSASNNEGSAIRKKKILIVWLRQIKHLLILGEVDNVN